MSAAAPLRLVCGLGDNTVPICMSLADQLADRLERPVTYDPDESWAARREAILAGRADVMWICGQLMVDLVDAGHRLRVVAAPIFTGRRRPTYGSVIVARGDVGDLGHVGDVGRVGDLATARWAVNELDSWSGCRVIAAHLGTLPDHIVTGSHRASIDAVLAGDADTAAIDDTLWAHLIGLDARLAELTVIDRTAEWPAPPFSTAGHLDADAAAAIEAALLAVTPAGLERIVGAEIDNYAVMRGPVAGTG